MPSVEYTRRRISLSRVVLALLFFRTLDIGIRLFRPDIVAEKERPRDVEDMGRQLRDWYDFVVVGAGSSGAVVANRLSEVPGWSVLLIEAGGDETLIGDVPLMMTSYQRTSADWQYKTEPDPAFCRAMIDNKCLWPRGKVLGGTSTINGMLYVRGNRRDYDNWERLGNDGWSYDDILPYFKKSEDMKLETLKNSTYHGTGGYLTVELYRFYSKLLDVLVGGIKELGYTMRDVNGERQDGFMYSYGTLKNGLRCSSSKAFVWPAKDRPNLDITLKSQVARVIIDPGSKRVQEVIFNKNGRDHTVSVRKEVVLSAGSINTPQILMLSGIGPRSHLETIGITPVISDLAVGQNLQDHICLGGLLYTVDAEFGFTLPRVTEMSSLTDMLFRNEGPAMAMGVAQVFGFQSSSYANNSEYPDVGYYLSPIGDNADGGVFIKRIVGYTDEFYNKVYEPILFKDSFVSFGCLMRPKSRGYLMLRDRNYMSHPLIYPKFLSQPDDVKILVEAGRFGQKLSETSPLRRIGAKMNPNKFPGCENLEMMSDEYLECALRMYTFTLWHPAGTCKMGPATDSESVVDSRLRVYGVQGLRVADASIMPDIVSGNLNIPCIMIGEKVSDMIKEDWQEL